MKNKPNSKAPSRSQSSSREKELLEQLEGYTALLEEKEELISSLNDYIQLLISERDRARRRLQQALDRIPA